MAITAVSLYLALRRVDFASVGHTLAAARIGPVLIALLAVFAAMLVKVVRWKLLLAGDQPSGRAAPLAPVANSFLASQLLNAIYPLRMGEIGRVAVVGAVMRDYAFVAGTIAVEKALDLLAFLGLIGLFPLLARLEPSRPPAGFAPVARALSSSWVLILLAFIGLAGFGLVGLRRYFQASDGLRARLSGYADRLLAGMTTLRRPRMLIAALLLTALIWIIALVPNYYALRALDLDLPPSAPVLILLVLQVGISIPSLPAKVGIIEYGSQLALSAYALGPEIGLSYGILLHGIVYLPMIVCGLPAIWFASLTRIPPTGDNTDVVRMEKA